MFHRDMCSPGRGTHITRDMCFPGRGTHITRDMFFPGRGTHITRDMCFPGRRTHIRDLLEKADKTLYKKRSNDPECLFF